MQRMQLEPEDQKVVNRWRLGVAGFYATVAIISIIVAAFTSSRNERIVETQLQATKMALPANARH
jgi:hypothetical protein